MRSTPLVEAVMLSLSSWRAISASGTLSLEKQTAKNREVALGWISSSNSADSKNRAFRTVKEIMEIPINITFSIISTAFNCESVG